MFYAQAVCGLSPTRAALLTAPMAIATGVLAPFVGKIVDRSHPRPVIGFGFSVLAIAMTWLSIEMTPTTPIWRLVLPITAMGIGSAFIWSPLAATATRNLPPRLAGAGSGVYNSTRQVGSVLGSAGMAAFMTWRISSEMPPMLTEGPADGSVELPAWLHEPFAAAMSQSLLLPAFFALFGVVAALFMLGFGNAELDDEDADDIDRNAGYAVEYGGDDTFVDDEFVDDDEYLEYEVSWDEPDVGPVKQAEPVMHADDPVTEPMKSRADHLLPAPGTSWHWEQPVEEEPEPAAPEPPRDAWRAILDELLSDIPPVKPKVDKAEPIGFAHNGFHVDDDQRFQPLPPPEKPRPSRHERAARHHRAEQPEKRPFWFESNGRHSRDDPDDASSYGRHSTPGRD
jgi:hypothetical protein